jgi:fluoride exporter
VRVTPLVFLAVCAAGGLGSAARFVLDGLIRARTRTSYPLGTTVINVSGSLLLGMVTGLAAHALLAPEWQMILGVGLMGGYTTFSTASVETVRLLQERRSIAAALNGLGMLALSVAAAALGLLIGTSA